MGSAKTGAGAGGDFELDRSQRGGWSLSKKSESRPRHLRPGGLATGSIGSKGNYFYTYLRQRRTCELHRALVR